ncbi:uncharacterized protein [Prorops nasuta]|uniref:uncharacterized protein n=1 Tax=Prorops nasuta TaxID=863751 RepID=UPI0034CD75AC
MLRMYLQFFYVLLLLFFVSIIERKIWCIEHNVSDRTFGTLDRIRDETFGKDREMVIERKIWCIEHNVSDRTFGTLDRIRDVTFGKDREMGGPWKGGSRDETSKDILVPPVRSGNKRKKKGTALKAQITTLSNILDNGTVEITFIKLRMKRLNDLYNNFEELFDELMVLEPKDEYQSDFDALQERFYHLASRVELLINPPTNSNEPSTASDSEFRNEGSSVSNSVDKQKVKLPEISLPVFNGQFEDWLTYKNAFQSLIGSRTDVSDVDKLHYLRSSLKGEAANKIGIFSVSSTNYSKAWEILEKAYEVKRVLISKHLSLILNLPSLEKESTKGFTKLADDMQQHIASLQTLGVNVTPEMAVYILESRLPKTTMRQWESLLSRDEYPELDKMYEFLYKCAVNASRRDRTRPHEGDADKGENQNKKRRKQSPGQTFTATATQTCIACQSNWHPLFRCESFKGLTPQDRNKPCKLSGCTVCNQRHNTLLHIERGLVNTNQGETKSGIDRSS